MTSLRSVLFATTISAFAIIGCGGSTSEPSASGGAAGAGATGGSGGTGGSGTGGAAGSATGGSAGAGGPCTTNADCPDSGVCGFPQAAGCAAEGTSFPAPGATCAAYSPGCACDGTEITVVCTGLPAGYVMKPLDHAGVCADAGTGGSGGKKFSCGPTLECDSATEYCKVGTGGPCCAPPSYACEPIPSACSQDPTCACIKPAIGAQECTEPDGNVTATFLYP